MPDTPPATLFAFTALDETQTAALARAIAPLLGPGDTLRLEGPLGAGKTHMARALIRALTSASEEVPSPTFALVQNYDTPGAPLWHLDLYRLEAPDDILDLGFEEAVDEAICLVEWPDKADAFMPAGALTLRLSLSAKGGKRDVTLAAAPGHDERWRLRLAPLERATLGHGG